MNRAQVVTLLVLSFAFALVVVLAFAGVEPLASGKDLLRESAVEFREVTTGALELGVARAGSVTAVERFSFGSGYQYDLRVYLTPSSAALPDEACHVDLYEKGALRESLTVTWNEPEINVLKPKAVYFSATRTEYAAYRGANIDHIFSVKVYR